MKRGGGVEPVSLSETERVAVNAFTGEVEDAADLLANLDLGLRKLEQRNPRTGRVVECRFYGGLTIEETASALDISPRTVKRDWVAQAWLRRELKEAS
jgi:DNA-directed RNA polymerase specialized sigma24 family protein